MKLISCQRAHYYRRGTGPTRTKQKQHSRGTLVSMSPSAGAGLTSEVFYALLCILVRLVSGAVPLVLTSRLFSRPH